MTVPGQPNPPVPAWIRDVERAADVAETASLTPEHRAELTAAARRIIAALDPDPTPDQAAEAQRFVEALAAAAMTAGTVTSAVIEGRPTGALHMLGGAYAATVLGFNVHRRRQQWRP